MISVQMQISDSEAYAKEFTLSQIIGAYHTCCKNIYGFELTNPSLLEIIQTLQKRALIFITLPFPQPACFGSS